MGGRGASSGISNKGNPYGSQYHTLYDEGNIKFIAKNARQSETLMETMTKGRVYVTVGVDNITGNEELISITYFDKNNKRSKTINLSHSHKGMLPHTHHGYEHNENDGPKGAANLTDKEREMVDRVKKIWDNHNKNRQ